MTVSRQDSSDEKPAESLDREEKKGPRARMRKTLLAGAMNLMQQGRIPSITDVAQATEVSRATAYRYFPSQAAMIEAAVLEALGPVLNWESESRDAEERLKDLLSFSLPRITEYEATHRSALWLAIDQWARKRGGQFDVEERLVRGSRRRLLGEALAPLASGLDEREFERLTQALSMIFGIEALVVLRDIWALDDDDMFDVIEWAAAAMVQKAVSEADGGRLAPSKDPERSSQA